MKKSLILTVLLILSTAIWAQINNPITWQFSDKQLSETSYELTFTANIQEGWHLYSTSIAEGGPIKTSFTFEENDQYTLVDGIQSLSKEIRKYDEMFEMEIGYYEKTATFTQKIELKSATSIKGIVEFMSCDESSCTPPQEVDFEFTITPSKNATIAPATNKDSAAPSSVDLAESTHSATAKTPTKTTTNDTESAHSLLWFFLFSFIAGLAAILTPCVFPMIPMTVSFFMHGEESKAKARRNALFYGLSIIGIYTIIGTLVSVLFGPGIANWLSTHWLPNLIFFAAFMIFAFSFFGMFEIVMPSSIVNKADKGADKGGLSGAFFMALTLVLVSFSCTGPIVGAILVQSAGGAILEPIIGMLGFSLAFALPFTVLALFPQWLNNMPKSGGWLNSVKVVLGFIELGLGLKFLSIADQTYHWGILDREIYLAIWIVLSALLGMYLLGKLRFSHDSKTEFVTVPKLLMAIGAFSFMVYLIPGMFGAPLKAISGYLPPMKSHDFDIHKIVREEVSLITNSQSISFHDAQNQVSKPIENVKYGEFLELPHGLTGFFDYEEGMAYAKAQNKPVFIDFTGHGCVNCREMEANVWSDPRVLERLKNDYVIIALYVDDKTKLPEEDWVVSDYDGKTKKTLGKKYADFQISRYKVNAQPYYILLNHEEEMLTTPTARDLNPDHFVTFLDEGLKAFSK